MGLFGKAFGSRKILAALWGSPVRCQGGAQQGTGARGEQDLDSEPDFPILAAGVLRRPRAQGPHDLSGKTFFQRESSGQSSTHNLLSGSQPKGWPMLTCPRYRTGKRARPIYRTVEGAPHQGTCGSRAVFRKIAAGSSGTENQNNLRFPPQVICQPSFSGVTFPVFHFHRSINNCRAKATMTCLRRRACALGFSRTLAHFCTSQ